MKLGLEATVPIYVAGAWHTLYEFSNYKCAFREDQG